MNGIRNQLMLSHIMLTLLMALVALVSIFSIVGLENELRETRYPAFRFISAMDSIRRGCQGVNMAGLTLLSGDGIDAHILFQHGRTQIGSGLDEAERWNPGGGFSIQIAGLSNDANQLIKVGDRFFESNNITLQQGAEKFIDLQINPRADKIRRTAGALAAQTGDLLRAEDAERTRATNLVVTRVILVSLIALFVALLLANRASGQVLRPMAALASRAKRAVSGQAKESEVVPDVVELKSILNEFEGIVANLTESRIRDRRRIKRAESISQAALRSIPDPVLVMDGSYRVRQVNESAERRFGRIANADGIPIDQYVADGALTRAIQSDEAADGDGGRVFVSLGANDAPTVFAVVVERIKEPDGRVLGVVAILENVTRLRQLDQIKDEFMRVASHELRTPVASLLLSVELLSEGAAGELKPKQRNIVDRQMEDLERLQTLLNELLDISRLQSGLYTPKLARSSVSSIISDARSACQALAEKSGVTLIETLPEPDIAIGADHALLSRGLVNLIINAVRHTASGGTVRISSDSKTDAVIFRVEDDGEGIPAEYLDKIFDRFFQVPGTSRSGAGLGLSISSEIARAHGGSLKVSSVMGKGSIFWFEIPQIRKLHE